MLLRHVLFHEIKRKIGYQLPTQVILAALLLATFFAKEQALHVMQNLNANQNLIHSNYSSEIYTAGQDSGLDKCRRVACIQRKLDCYRSI